MSHAQEIIELTLRVTAFDEATAVHASEVLARMTVGLSAENVEVAMDVDRFERVCQHVHDEDEAQP